MTNTPTDREISESMRLSRQREHAKVNPDGCSDWCDDCQRRLACKDGRHEWPRDFSDGDMCYCGEFYLVANAADERPHILENRR